MSGNQDANHRLTVRLPPKVWNAVRLAALKGDTTYNSVVLKALREKVGEMEKMQFGASID
jgi:predicted HicB family RNase H-like nuclease